MKSHLLKALRQRVRFGRKRALTLDVSSEVHKIPPPHIYPTLHPGVDTLPYLAESMAHRLSRCHPDITSYLVIGMWPRLHGGAIFTIDTMSD
eukprot:517212-Amphidinium_carterae.1